MARGQRLSLVLFTTLLILLLFGAGNSRDFSVKSCNVRAADCSTFEDKIPSLSLPIVARSAVTAALGSADRRMFEHALGHALRDTAAVRWVTREFSKRVVRFLIEVGTSFFG